MRAESFYCWVEDRPMPPWQYAMAALMALIILCICLFPLAPVWLRTIVVYFFLGLLCSIFALILVRFLIFLIIFAFVGVPLGPTPLRCLRL
jgi:translocation protein SEC62